VNEIKLINNKNTNMQDITTLYDVFMPPAGTTITTTRPMTKKERKDVAMSKLAKFTVEILQSAARYDGITYIYFKHNGYRVSLNILDDAIVVNTMHVSESYKVQSQTYPYVSKLEGELTAYKWMMNLKDCCVHLKIIKLVNRNVNNKKALNGMKQKKNTAVNCCKTCGTQLSDAL
jgi:hypothetical protein